jgi:hypothetical protein
LAICEPQNFVSAEGRAHARRCRTDQVGRDRRHLVQPGLAELALDVVFAGKAEAAVELDAGIGRFPGGLGRQVLGHVGLGAAGLVGVEQAAGFPAHQVGGLDLDVGLGDRKLHALVLADGAAEHHALLDVGADLVDEPVAVADAFGGNQGALGIQPVKDVLEALAFLADQVFASGISRLSKNSSLVS